MLAARPLGRLCTKAPRTARATRLVTMAQYAPRFDIAVKGAGNQLGDCPFCQRALLTLEEKGVPYQKTLVDFAAKPDWLLEVNPAGSVPVMKDLQTGEWIVDSGVIADRLEEMFPQPALGTAESAPQVGGGIFPAFVQFFKAKEPAAATEKEAALLAELEGLNSWLEQHGGTFTGGESVTATDLSLMPKLYHMTVALDHFKGWQLPERFGAVKRYMAAFEGRPSWKATYYPPELVIKGWAPKLEA